MTRTMLLSVYDKTNLIEYVRQLIDRDWKLLASGGTAKVIQAAGLAVKVVGEVMLRHRVATLYPEIHGGLIAEDIPEDRAELQKRGIDWIDGVCVHLYPLLDAIKKPEATKRSVIEMTDIGGPTMLSSAAKGRRFVLCHTSELEKFIAWLDGGEQNPDLLRNDMAVKADITVSTYRLTSALYHTQDPQEFRRLQAVYNNFTGEPFPLSFDQRA